MDAVKFWSTQPVASSSLSSLWLSDSTDSCSTQEVEEIISMLPDLNNKSVLELGAGSGRFTEALARRTQHVTAVDVVMKFLDENKKRNKNLQNIDYQCTDVRHLQNTPNKYDVIFTNGLLMYLTDEEITTLLLTCLSLLKHNGSLFFHETCFHNPGNRSSDLDVTLYRRPELYNSLFPPVTIATNDNKGFYAFQLVISKSIQTHVKLNGTSNQICWLLEKSRVGNEECHGFKTFQEFLDSKQYSRNGILRYERIFGEDYVSTGGSQTTEEFVKLLNLKPGQHVLDVGCGIGGGAFYMAKTYGALITGIDLSSNMISIALERAEKYQDNRVQFEISDATKRQFAPNSFDVVYSRDTILHITDKKSLFTQFLKWLKPGGKLLISDYCCKAGQWSQEFTDYVKQRGYVLLSVQDYGKVLEDSGFVNVRAEDKTDLFVDVLNRELKHMNNIRADFIKEFSEKDLNDLETGWTDKVRRCGAGDQKWGLFYAEKPLPSS